jgi:hypothetical protein
VAGVFLLGALAVAVASFVLATVQMFAPLRMVGASLSPAPASSYQDPTFDRAAVTLAITLDVGADQGSGHATFRVTLPATDPVAQSVGHGDAESDPDSFVQDMFGSIGTQSDFDWAAPTEDVTAQQATITITGTTHWTPTADDALLFTSVHATQVDFTSRGSTVTGVTGAQTITARSSTGLTAEVAPSSPLGINLSPDAVLASSSNPPNTVLSALGTAGSFLLSAIPWAVLYFAGRWWSRDGRPIAPHWWRFLRVVKVVLCAHVLLVGLVAVEPIESDLELSWGNVLGPMLTGIGWATFPVFQVLGSIVVLLVALGFLAPQLVRSWSPPARGPGPVALTAIVVLVLAGAAMLGYWWASAGQASIAIFAIPGLALVVLLIVAALVSWLFRPADRFALLIAAPLAVSAAMLASRMTVPGPLPSAAQFVPLVGAGAAALLAVGQFTMLAVAGRRWRAGWWFVLLVPLAAVLTYPVNQRPDQSPVILSNTANLALRIDGLPGFVLLAALVGVLHKLGRAPTTLPSNAAAHRMLGLGAAFVALSGCFVLTGGPTIAAILAAGVGAFVLLPKGKVRIAAVLAKLDEPIRGAAVRTALAAASARQTLPAMRKTLRDKVAGGDLDASKARTLWLTEEEIGYPSLVDGVSVMERAFGGLHDPRPWRRAVWGAGWGTVFGLPWTAIAVYSALPHLPAGDPYPILASVASVLPAFIRWSAYGLLFGYFYPLIRGETGYGKGWALFAAAAAPSLADAVISHAAGGSWVGVLLSVVQVLTFSLTLGLSADRAVLRRHAQRHALSDVYNMNSLAAWASSVAVAAGTALATALIAGLGPFINGVIHPPSTVQPPTPPASSAPPT